LATQNRLRLLAVLAHPDDESFGPGGTLARYAQQGVEVHLICATYGEAGEVPENFAKDHDSIADLRKTELNCAASILGLAGVHFLGYRDSGMPGTAENKHPSALVNAALDEVAAKVTYLIRQLRPQVIITFDPIGGYRHPDHIAINKATVKAFHAAGDPAQYPDDQDLYQPEKLYYSTFSRNFLRVMIFLMPILGLDPRRWGRNQDIDLIEIASHRFPIHASIDIRAVADLKDRASKCHASQLDGGPPTNGVMRWLLRLSGGNETFMRAHPPAPPGLREKDLFDGISTNA
jgi:N-acetyl-1-D-myo-inositol-2-amino-2-deoxy-alpha-D-glucopyranoside deacetylase/mycothiol S-conjugate amidase